MNRKRFEFGVLLAAGYLLAINSSAFGEDIKGKILPGGQIPVPKVPDLAPAIESPKIKTSAKEKDKDEVKVVEVPIENVVSVTTEQLVNKAQDYLNKNVKFTAPFFAYSNLALDFKPAFRSSRTYLSFLILRPNSKIPFSELKLDMLIPKEKDPQTKMLATLKEGDTIEVTGHVFACPLDEPWVDVLRLKRIASVKKNDIAEDKSGDEKDPTDDQSSEDKNK